ncbi:MAG: ABC transporter permease [Fibrobacterales bacterium]
MQEAKPFILDELAIMLGSNVRGLLGRLYSYFSFIKNLLMNVHMVIFNFHLTVEQMYAIGITSIPLVLTTSVFTGAVTAWQMAYQFADMIPLTYVGMAVGKSVMLELGPMLTGMVLAGRIGAAMCAEIGTMAVTEQLDAMHCLALNPFRFLLAPRLVATLIMLPVLTVLSSFIAILGGYAVSHFKGISFDMFFYGVRLFYTNGDLAVGLTKSLIFGFFIASFGCYFGYTATNGAVGVGKATKAAVVASMIAILIAGFTTSKVLL